MRDPRVAECLDRVLGSPLFQRADRQSRFLRHVVERTLAGDAASLKEYSIGVQVYGRPEDYEPRVDPIVRVEASRLRARLREYYELEGGADPVRFELPKGTYAVRIVDQGEAAEGEAAEPVPEPAPPVAAVPPRRSPWLVPAGLAALTVVGLVGWLGVFRRTGESIQPIRSIAVLPFQDLSERKDQAYICAGLTEQITEELMRIREVRIVGQNSVGRLAGPVTDLAKAGRDLGAVAILQGSVRTEGARVRVTARLSESETGYGIWSGTFDGSKDDLFSFEDRISFALARKLAVRLDGRREASSVRNAPQRLRAYDLMVQARDMRRQATAYNGQQVLRVARSAVEADPAYAAAHAALAQSYAALNQRDLAEAEARRAIELDPGLSDGYSALIRVYRDFDLNWKEARRTCAQGLGQIPNGPALIRSCAIIESLVGDQDKAVAEMRRSVELDPLVPQYRATLGLLLYRAGKLDEAVEEARRAVADSPDSLGYRRLLIVVLAARHEYSDALKEIADGRKAGGGPLDWLPAEGFVLGQMGRKSDAAARLAELEATPGAAPMGKALIAFGMGERDRMYRYLESAPKQSDGGTASFLVQYHTRCLMGEPRYEALRARVGLPPSGR